MVKFIGTYPAVNDLPMLAASRGRANNAPMYMYLQLVHHLVVCIVIVAKLKAVSKVPAVPSSGKFGHPPHGYQVYEALPGRLPSM